VEAIGLLLVLVSIPLVLRWVPRNRLYGFRIPATLGNESVWYDVNALHGRHLLSLGVLMVALDFALTTSTRIPVLATIRHGGPGRHRRQRLAHREPPAPRARSPTPSSGAPVTRRVSRIETPVLMPKRVTRLALVVRRRGRTHASGPGTDPLFAIPRTARPLHQSWSCRGIPMARTRTSRGHGSLDPHRQFLLDELTNALQVAVLLIQDAQRAASGR